ncbi:FAD-dependent oxidoreductase [Salinispora pacifica]|uniref:FAD-dependent oxidoreductase n=1 Tax=Salinispora pacifica TaxID=351187 RepID=UPI0004843C52|nr:FAD-dependent oxidoreductase [Salinispora pacifica]
MTDRIVIVGNGMAGTRLAGELSARGGDRKVTVLGAEPHRAYNRILLSTLLTGAIGEPEVQLTEVAGHGVDLRTGVRVTAIDREDRTVRTDRGDQIHYDHLVLATGSRSVVPPLTGLTGGELPDRVVSFRTLDDCRRILAVADRAHRVLVLGGGLLGLEAARGLAGRGLEVTVVHPVPYLMERQLDPAAAAVLAGTLAGLGVTTQLAVPATAVLAGPRGVRLELADGRSLDADLLVLACGVRPDTALATAADLAVRQGVLVDDRLRTNDQRISAIGDCAQHGETLTGLVAPAWAQARVLAQLLSGADPSARYRPRPVVTRLKTAGIDLAAMGDPGDGPGEELTFTDPAAGTYARLRINHERLTAAILLGDNPSVGTVIQLFDRGQPVPSDRRSLLLGRAPGPGSAEPASTPALMPAAATVCHCNNVNKGTLVESWRRGARTVDEVVAATRAGTGCGSCRDAVAGIVDWLSTVESVEVGR